jgi:hypothetical protein
VELRKARRTTDVARRTPQLVERLCEGVAERGQRHDPVVVTDSVTSRPLPSLRGWLRWAGRVVGNVERPETLTPTAVGGNETLTDATGTATFCDVPADVKLVFSAIKPDGKPAADSTDLRVSKSEIRVWTVVTRRQ